MNVLQAVTQVPICFNVKTDNQKTNKIQNNIIENKIAQNPASVLKNDSAMRVFVNMQNANNTLSSIKFAGSSDTRQKAYQESMNFGMDIIDACKGNYKIDFTQSLKAYLKKLGQDDVDITYITLSSKYKNLVGAGYAPKNNVEYQGGTIYIPQLQDFNNPKSVLFYIQLMSQALCRAQHDKLHPISCQFKNLSNQDKDYLNFAECFINDFTQHIDEPLQQGPLQYVLNNYEQYGFEPIDLIKHAIQDYDTFSTKKKKNFSQTDVYQAFGGKQSFSESINTIMYNVISSFANSDSIDEKYKNNPQIYNYFLQCAVNAFENDANAYQVSSDLNKYAQNIDKNESTLYDLPPLTYKAVAKELKPVSKLIKKGCNFNTVNYTDVTNILYSLFCVPENIEFANWYIDELEKPENKRQMNKSLSIQDLPKLISGMEKDDIDIAKRTCKQDNVNAKTIKSIVVTAECYPDGKEFANWYMDELEKPEDERKLNKIYSISDLPKLISGMKENSIEKTKRKCCQ